MPELPDVAAFKQYFDSTALHKEITAVTVNHEGILEDISAQALQSGLKGGSRIRVYPPAWQISVCRTR